MVLGMMSDFQLYPRHFGHYLGDFGFIYLFCLFYQAATRLCLAYKSWPIFMGCGSNDILFSEHFDILIA